MSRVFSWYALWIGLLGVLSMALIPACSAEPAAVPTQITDAPPMQTTAHPATPVTVASPTPVLTVPSMPTPPALPTLFVAPGVVPSPTATRHPTASEAAPPAQRLTIVVAAVPSPIPAYDRGEWRHWTDEDGDCQDTRQEVLVAESLNPVTFEDMRQCRVASGLWSGPYTAESFDSPRSLDVDHMVPLGNAHQSGGWAWSPEMKRQYANDLSYDGHLIAVKASANRSKGSKSPADWKPPDHSYWCLYAIDWITIKNAWQLTATQPEAEALGTMLATCMPARAVEIAQSEAPQTAPTPISPVLTPETHASCDAAVAAGEPRVQGTKGSGRGFPQATVPSARDGDGDGVVCER